jgi:hypothetical protein
LPKPIKIQTNLKLLLSEIRNRNSEIGSPSANFTFHLFHEVSALTPEDALAWKFAEGEKSYLQMNTIAKC